MRNAKNIARHELIGLECSVAEAGNSSLAGIRGKVIDETMKSLLIKTPNGRKRVMKKDVIFRFRVGKQAVDVDGNAITARPEDRIKKNVKRW